MNKTAPNCEFIFQVQQNPDVRLDVYLAGNVESLSRSKIHELILSGDVLVNGIRSKPGYRLRNSDRISIKIPEPEPLDIVPQEMMMNILYEDDHYLAVNKPPGVVVHPGAGNKTGTLVSGLLYHTKTLSTLGGKLRPGLVHRLDKDTSGVIVVAKTNEAHWKLGKLFAERKIYKEYRVLVWGIPQQENGIVEGAISRDSRDRKKFSVSESGKFARSRYSIVEAFEIASHLKVVIETGRTHQIRVHMQSIGHPVVGDKTYGGDKRSFDSFSKIVSDVGLQLIAKTRRQMLHARCIQFMHPFTDRDLRITAPLPDDFCENINLLKQISGNING